LRLNNRPNLGIILLSKIGRCKILRFLLKFMGVTSWRVANGLPLGRASGKNTAHQKVVSSKSTTFDEVVT
jgi:hypothetical protein